MANGSPLRRTPYFFLAWRPFREERLVSYIRRQHSHGRHLGEIIDDPYIARLGSRQLVWQTLRDTPLIELLEADIREEFERQKRTLTSSNGPGPTSDERSEAPSRPGGHSGTLAHPTILSPETKRRLP